MFSPRANPPQGGKFLVKGNHLKRYNWALLRNRQNGFIYDWFLKRFRLRLSIAKRHSANVELQNAK